MQFKKKNYKRFKFWELTCPYSVQDLFFFRLLYWNLTTLPLVMHVCETWPLTWRNMELGFLGKGDEDNEWIYLEVLTDGREKLLNEKFHDLWPLPNIIITIINSSRMRWARRLDRTEERRNAHSVVKVNPTRRCLLGSPRRSWEANIKWI